MRGFVAVTAILFLSFGFAIGCPAGDRVIEEQVREPGATIRIKDFVRESIRADGRTEWRVDAGEAFIFDRGEEDNRVIAYEFRFVQYDDQGKVMDRLIAERGEIDYNAAIVKVSGAVRFWSASGRQVEAESLEYDRETQILQSEQPLKIIERGNVTLCQRGAEIDNQNNRQLCRAPVVAAQSSDASNHAGENSNPLDLFE